MRNAMVLVLLCLIISNLFAYVIVDTSDISLFALDYIGDLINERATVLSVDLTWEFFPYSLEPDVLFHILPAISFSTSESEWLVEWVSSGGTLVLIGENGVLGYSDEIINDLLGSGGFGLEDSIVPSMVLDSTRWIIPPRDNWITVDPNPRENLVFGTDSFAVLASSYIVLGSSGKSLVVLGDSACCELGSVGKQPVASQIRSGSGQILLFADLNLIICNSAFPGYDLYLSYCNRDLLDRILLIGTDDINEQNGRPDNFALSAYPNPFNSAVTIAAPAGAEVEVFDVKGRRVAELASGDQFWKPEPSVGSGVYLVRAKIGDGQTATKRVVYLK